MACFHYPSPSHLNINMNMNVSLPTEILSTIHHWQQHKHKHVPLTPPCSTPQRHSLPSHTHTPTILPPIASFDHPAPSAPSYSPYKQPLAHSPARLPPIHSHAPDPAAIAGPSRPITPLPTPPPPSQPAIADWFSDSHHWSSQILAEKTCEMICYLWFSKSSSPPPATSNRSPSLSYFPNRNAHTAYLQFSVSSVFVNFMQKLLQTTQLSQSVIVLSLHYVYRLKERNYGTLPAPGSEFRVAVSGLMMANKFVDDNTYTNKTWSEVSGIELTEINKMEREFLEGIDFNLYVDKQTYDAWVNLLKGLVMAKERDSRHFRRSRQAPRAMTVSRPTAIVPPLSVPPHRSSAWSPRARSTSPVRTFRSTQPTAMSFVPHPSQYSPDVHMYADSPLRSGAKRTAVDAFSPTSASFDLERPAKKPTGLALDIPQSIARGPHTPSPLESLQFSKLSLGSSPAVQAMSDSGIISTRRVSPRTLVAAYRVDPTRPRPGPQALYFYSLAGSPLTEDGRPRKGRLHYHQPPAPSAPAMYYPPQPVPFVVQSASASPHELHTTLPPVLPNPYDGAWAHPRETSNGYDPCQMRDSQHAFHARRDSTQSSVPSAPFANAGPPGVHFYQPPTTLRSPAQHWNRGRRL